MGHCMGETLTDRILLCSLCVVQMAAVPVAPAMHPLVAGVTVTTLSYFFLPLYFMSLVNLWHAATTPAVTVLGLFFTTVVFGFFALFVFRQMREEFQEAAGALNAMVLLW